LHFFGRDESSKEAADGRAKTWCEGRSECASTVLIGVKSLAGMLPCGASCLLALLGTSPYWLQIQHVKMSGGLDVLQPK
jgi:hypothetical protein